MQGGKIGGERELFPEEVGGVGGKRLEESHCHASQVELGERVKS